MRRSALLPVFLQLALPGCGGGDPGYTVIDGFRERAAPLACAAIERVRGYAVTEIRSATDSTWTVLDEAQRLVALFDEDMRRIWEVHYPAVGPGAVESAVSAVPLGDSAVAIAARGNLRLVVLSLRGEERGTTPLDFVPASLAAPGDGSLLVTAMPIGPSPPTLLMRWQRDSLTPVPIAKRKYPDMIVASLGNTALVETLADGSALVVHQFFAPRAFALSPSGAIEALSLPTPDLTRDRIHFIPTPPVTERQMLQMLVPAIAMTVDRGAAEVYVMTRTERLSGSRPQRAILRLDRRLRFLQGFITDIPAAAMVYLPRRHTLLLVDDEDRFHACTIQPAASTPPVAREPRGAQGPESRG